MTLVKSLRPERRGCNRSMVQAVLSFVKSREQAEAMPEVTMVLCRKVAESCREVDEMCRWVG